MRIIAYTERPSGVSYHRLIMPLLLMPEIDLYITNNLLEDHFEKGCDIFFYCRSLPDHCIEKLNELKEKYNFKTVVDVDDYWILDEYHPLYKSYIDTNYEKEQIYHLLNADMVLTTNSYLHSEIVPYNPNVHIVPNAIPKQGQFVIERNTSPFTRLFWQGSMTHEADISLLYPVTNNLAHISQKVKMVLAGFSQDTEWHRMAHSYTAGFKHQYHLLEGLHITEYYNHYKEADVCLVPLLNTKFNRCKSNLKVLEAANLGLPVICSPVGPYLDMPVIYARKTEQWISSIERLVHSKKRQKDAGEKLKEFCDINFNFEKINLKRKTLLEQCLR